MGETAKQVVIGGELGKSLVALKAVLVLSAAVGMMWSCGRMLEHMVHRPEVLKLRYVQRKQGHLLRSSSPLIVMGRLAAHHLPLTPSSYYRRSMVPPDRADQMASVASPNSK